MDNYARNDGADGQAADGYRNPGMGGFAQSPNVALAAQQSQPLHARLQDANTRAIGVAEKLAALTSAMLPPVPSINNVIAGQESAKDSTVSGEIDDLIRTLCRISANVSRLSVAITGAA